MQNSLPDNLLSKVTRLYVAEKEFKNDSGQTIKYSRLCVDVLIKDESATLEFPIDKKDKMILALADQIPEKSLL